MIPEILFSDHTHAKFNRTLYLFRDQLNNLVEDLSIKANGWSQSWKYKEFFSAWSAYYDGGMAVVVIVITLLLCRMVMFCTPILRRNSSSQVKTKHPRNTTNRSEANVIGNGRELDAIPRTKSQKEKLRKNRKKSKEKTSQIDISLKGYEETPELQDETHVIDCIPNGSDNRILISVPSIVSLEG